MFEHILIALDGSMAARSAADQGLRVAKRVGARVTGLSVIDVRVVEGPAVETLSPLWGEVTGRPFQPEVMRLYRERADAAVEEFCAAAQAAGIEGIERRIEIGVAEDAILDCAAHSDLLVMGRTGEHAAVGRRSMGATLWRVLHRAPCPVLVAGDTTRSARDESVEEKHGTRRALVAWEPGPGAAGALDLALVHCHATGAQLCVVHAGDESNEQHMDALHARLADAGVSWESVRLALDPPEAVSEAFLRWRPDWVFMGAFGRGRLRDLLFGSNTAGIFERIHAPVFVCR